MHLPPLSSISPPVSASSSSTSSGDLAAALTAAAAVLDSATGAAASLAVEVAVATVVAYTSPPVATSHRLLRHRTPRSRRTAALRVREQACGSSLPAWVLAGCSRLWSLPQQRLCGQCNLCLALWLRAFHDWIPHPRPPWLCSHLVALQQKRYQQARGRPLGFHIKGGSACTAASAHSGTGTKVATSSVMAAYVKRLIKAKPTVLRTAMGQQR